MKLKAGAQAPLWWGTIEKPHFTDGEGLEIVWRCPHPHKTKQEAIACAKAKLKSLEKRRKK